MAGTIQTGHEDDWWSQPQPWHAVFPIRFFIHQIMLLHASRLMQVHPYSNAWAPEKRHSGVRAGLVLGTVLPTNFLGLAQVMPEEEFKALYQRVCRYCSEGYPHNTPTVEAMKSQMAWLDPIIKPLEAIEAVRFPNVSRVFIATTQRHHSDAVSMIDDYLHRRPEFDSKADQRSASIQVENLRMHEQLNQLAREQLASRAILESASAPQRETGWTKSKLVIRCGVNGLSDSSFDRIREAASLDPGKRGRKFGVEDVKAMLAVAPIATPAVAPIVERAWRPLVSNA